MIISIVLIIGYLILLVGNIPTSLSRSYYTYKNIFPIWLFLTTAFSVPDFLSTESHSWLIFIALAAILFVAAAPNFLEDKFVDVVHTTSAIIALIFSQLWVAINLPIALSAWLVILIYIIVHYKEKLFSETRLKFYSELVMLLTSYITLIWLKREEVLQVLELD